MAYYMRMLDAKFKKPPTIGIESAFVVFYFVCIALFVKTKTIVCQEMY